MSVVVVMEIRIKIMGKGNGAKIASIVRGNKVIKVIIVIIGIDLDPDLDPDLGLNENVD